MKVVPGQVFSRLTVVNRRRNKCGRRQWFCTCLCGGHVMTDTAKLLSGRVKSCGCYRRDLNTKHGLSDTVDYQRWEAVIDRCHNPNNPQYKDYGGRGIKVCIRWRHSYPNFLEDMGLCPAGKTLNRIDNDKGYCKENCNWATRHEQMRNRSNNVWLTYKGARKIAADWADELGMKRKTLLSRLKYGWSVERTLTEPVIHKHSGWFR